MLKASGECVVQVSRVTRTVALIMTPALADRLRRFMQQHNIGYEQSLARQVYYPLVDTLDEIGEQRCEEEFEASQRAVALDTVQLALAL